jgi:hypothetical protein
LPACQSALQPWVSLGLLYDQSPPGVWFLNTVIFYRMGLLAPCPTPILEDQGVSLLVWTLPLDLTGMVALLIVKLPPAMLSGPQSRTSPTTMTRWRHPLEGGVKLLDFIHICGVMLGMNIRVAQKFGTD